MKGEYVDGAKNENTRHNHNNNMFSKLHHSHHHHQQQQQQQQQHHQHQHHHQHQQHSLPHQFHPFAANPFQLNNSRECQTSSDNADDTATTTTTTTPSAAGTHKRPSSSEPHTAPLPSSGDGATIEVVRRPRGRPPGSKNKPKPPVIITRDTEPAMSPYILEVPGGNDVVEAIAKFCRRKNMGLCILTGSGTVANVTLRQPSTTPGATVTFHGRFDILSVAATFLPQPAGSPGAGPAMPAGFTISLAGPQGQIVGGIVAGALIAAGTVYVVAASFNSPSYHRLPAAEEGSPAAGGSGEGQSPAGSGGGESGGHGTTEGSGGMGGGMYGCHVAPPDVVWAPTARQPPPY